MMREDHRSPLQRYASTLRNQLHRAAFLGQTVLRKSSRAFEIGENLRCGNASKGLPPGLRTPDIRVVGKGSRV
eukprot:2927954-Rhodomonas_salina.3